jgi:ketol-acid reductoisomerase
MKVFYEADTDLSALAGKTIAMVGYGNQGRAQALNLRDSGIKVVIGNRNDDYAITVRQDGFSPVPILEAVKGAGTNGKYRTASSPSRYSIPS